MNAKLTLRLDDGLIASAKAYAAQHGRSLSDLVAHYFSRIAEPPAASAKPDAVATALESKSSLLKPDWRATARPSKFLGLAKTDFPMTDEELREERYATLARKHA